MQNSVAIGAVFPQSSGMRRLIVRRCLPLVVSLALVGLGCAHEPLVGVGDGPIRLEEGEGLLVVDIDADFRLTLLVIDGRRLWRNEYTRPLEVVRLEAGRYSMDRALEHSIDGSGWVYPLESIPGNDFEVVAGEICYPGTLVIERDQRARAYAARFVNRSGHVLQRLEQEHPKLLSAFPLSYTGPTKDDFLREYFAARRRLATDGAPDTE